MSHDVTNIMIMVITSGLGGMLMITPRAFRRGGGGGRRALGHRALQLAQEMPP